MSSLLLGCSRRRLGRSGSRRGAVCKGSRASWRWSGSKYWRVRHSPIPGYGLQAEARPPVDGLVDVATAARAWARTPRRRSGAARLDLAHPARRPGKSARAGPAATPRRHDPRARPAGRSAASRLGPAVARSLRYAPARDRRMVLARPGRRVRNSMSRSPAAGSTPASRSPNWWRARRTASSSLRRH